MTRGTFTDGTDWAIDDWCVIEVFYTNEQHSLCLKEEDVIGLVEGLVQWRQEKVIKDAKVKADKEKKDYEDYLRLKEKFEK